MTSEKPAKTSDWLLFHSSMDRMKMMPRAGQRKGAQTKAHTPSALLLSDELQRREEARRLEEVERSPGSLPTQWFLQMVVEVGISG